MSQLRLLNVNAQSIVNKVEKLESVLLSYDPHVTVLTETWLHDDIGNDEIVPPNYKLFRRDRSSRGGGVAVVTKSNVDVVVLDQIVDHESLFLKLTCWGNVLILVSAYRPPSADSDFLFKLYDHIEKYSNHKIILVGDFNLPDVDWDKLKAFSRESEFLLELALRYDLSQTVK